MNFKVLTFCVLVLFISDRALGQTKIETALLELQPPDPPLVVKYQKMKNTGATLTVLGSILFVVGVVTLSNTNLMYEGDDSKLQAGVLSSIAGMGCLGSGIPLWIVGAHKLKKVSKLRSVSVKPIAGMQYQGLTFSVRF